MKHQTRIITAGMFGNLIETFDVALCGLLSIYLSKYLIGDTTNGLILLFIMFFTAYLARPLGALLLGLLSDKYGRKITLASSILCMGLATSFIGLIPSTNVMGVYSIIILLLLRMIQNLSCGAEYLNSSAYLIENSDISSKGYTGSWASFGSMAGLLAASVVTLIATSILKNYPQLEWIIWRIPFILALLGTSLGLYIRLCIPESLEYIIYYADHPKPTCRNLLLKSINYIFSNKTQSLYVFALSSLGVTTTFQIYIYGPTQAHIYGYFTDYQIMIANITSLVVVLCIFPIIGKLSDRINREKIVITASLGFLLLSQPYFLFLSNNNYELFVFCQCLISVPAAAYYATVPVLLAEMFPLSLRCTVLSVLYSIAASFSAGLAPLLSILLLRWTHNPLSPALLSVGLVIFALAMMWVNNKQNERYFDSPVSAT